MWGCDLGDWVCRCMSVHQKSSLRVLQVPQQQNSVDCGVFVCAFCFFIIHDMPMWFSQDDIRFFRRHIALSIEECGIVPTYLSKEHNPHSGWSVAAGFVPPPSNRWIDLLLLICMIGVIKYIMSSQSDIGGTLTFKEIGPTFLLWTLRTSKYESECKSLVVI